MMRLEYLIIDFCNAVIYYDEECYVANNIGEGLRRPHKMNNE